MTPIRLLNLGKITPIDTQTLYHTIAERMTADTPDTIIICRPASPYVCIGYHQILDSIIDRSTCETRNLPIYRRRVGGGTTYLDSDQLFYQCIFHHSRTPLRFDRVYARMLAAPVAVLRQLGLNATLRAVNEIEVDSKRIAGIGGGRIREANVVVGNLLFRFDYEAMAALWRVPSRDFRDLGARAMQSHMTTLQQLLGDVSMPAITTALIEQFAHQLGRPLEAGSLTPEEIAHVQTVTQRLSDPAYLDLHSPTEPAPPMTKLKIAADTFIQAAKTTINGYTIEADFHLHKNIIQHARLRSTPPRDWQPTADQLRGTPYEDWQKHLPTLGA